MRKRIIITYKYPFEPPAEVFLHNELMAQCVEIIPTMFLPTASHLETNNVYELVDGSLVANKKHLGKISSLFFALKGVFKCIPQIIYDILMHKTNCKTIKSNIKSFAWCGIKENAFLDEIKAFTEGCDEIIIYSYWFGCYALLACFLKRDLKKVFPGINVRVICRAHGQGDLYKPPGIIHRAGFSLLNHNIDAIFPISELGKTSLLEEFTKPVIMVQRLGVDGYCHYLPLVNRKEFIIVSCSTVNDNKKKICSRL